METVDAGKQVQQSPIKNRQAISANTAVQRSTLDETDMRLFVGINGAVDWLKTHGER
jgi:exosome complex RNA-binding protein Rrp4